MTKEFGLYVHIPFCASICSYCDFYKRIKKDSNQEDLYIDRLLIELEEKSDLFTKGLNTIFIGGGTPNSLSDKNLERLLKYLSTIKNIKEFSIETNPELFTKNQAILFKKYNVNRVSMGVQTFNQDILRSLNRKHSNLDVFKEVSLLKSVGITNISIDLMFGLPNETKSIIEEDLKRFYELDIPHISYYSLILEEKTVLYNKVKKGLVSIPSDDIVADNFAYIRNALKKNGYNQYEISNWSKTGFNSIHNLHYWKYNDYIAVGAGATGLLNNNYRYTNTFNIHDYLNSSDIVMTKETLNIEDNKTEYMIMGLRKLQGVNLLDYQKRFNSRLIDDFDIKKILKEELIKIVDSNLFLTEKGIPLANIVWEVFV